MRDGYGVPDPVHQCETLFHTDSCSDSLVVIICSELPKFCTDHGATLRHGSSALAVPGDASSSFWVAAKEFSSSHHNRDV